MAKTREVFIIIGGIAVLAAALWFWLYLRPSNARVYELRNDIAARRIRLDTTRRDAENRVERYAIMNARFEELSRQWEIAAADLPDYFDDLEVLRHLQRVIYPHTETIQLNFGLSTRREADLLYSTIVNLEFTTSYWQFLTVLYQLIEEEALGNRVINYTIDVRPMTGDEESAFRTAVPGFAEYMPPHVFAQVQANVLGMADVLFRGLYMLRIEMQLEYLSLQPGMLSEGAMRALWAQLEAEIAALEAEIAAALEEQPEAEDNA
jgi:hypothetical protein